MSDTIYAAIELYTTDDESDGTYMQEEIKLVLDPLKERLTMWRSRKLVTALWGTDIGKKVSMETMLPPETFGYHVPCYSFLDLLGNFNKEGRLNDVRYGYSAPVAEGGNC